jgi:hypothetical protein
MDASMSRPNGELGSGDTTTLDLPVAFAVEGGVMHASAGRGFTDLDASQAHLLSDVHDLPRGNFVTGVSSRAFELWQILRDGSWAGMNARDAVDVWQARLSLTFRSVMLAGRLPTRHAVPPSLFLRLRARTRFD